MSEAGSIEPCQDPAAIPGAKLRAGERFQTYGIPRLHPLTTRQVRRRLDCARAGCADPGLLMQVNAWPPWQA
jgi:hypothetical protein